MTPHKFLHKLDDSVIQELKTYCINYDIELAIKRNENVFNRDDCRLVLPLSYGKIVFEKSYELCKPVLLKLSNLKQLYNLIPYRIELSYIRPGCKVYPHVDSLYFHSKCTRVHVPISTNGSYYAGGNPVMIPCIMHEAEVWMINNKVLHTAENNTEDIRIHMIIDYASSDDFGELMNNEKLAKKAVV